MIDRQDMLGTQARLERTTEKIGFVAHMLETEALKDHGEAIFGSEAYDLPGAANILNDAVEDLYRVVIWLSDNNIADIIEKASEIEPTSTTRGPNGKARDLSVW